MHKIFNPKYLLWLIIVLSILLRFYKITQNPPALNWDEVSHGYNAYSILNTAKDEWGEKLPIAFRVYGDYKLPVYIYTVVPFIKLFGLNELSVRLPSVLAGALTVIFTYFLVVELFRNSSIKLLITSRKSLALVASLLVAVEPWSLFLSRGAFGANLGLCLFLIGLYFLMRALKEALFLMPSFLFFGLSVWTYNSYRIFTPIFLVLFVFLYKKQLFGIFKKSKIKVLSAVLILLFFFIPMFIQLLKPVGLARYGKLSLLDEGAIGRIIAQREEKNLPVFIERVVYNRYSYFGYTFFNNWVKHYSPNFLFIKGGDNYQFSIPGRGIIYGVNAVFLIIGVWYLFIKRSKEGFLILGWFFLGSIPSSITRESPHVLRAITMLPVPMIITSIGLVGFYKLLINKIEKWKYKSFKNIVQYFIVGLYLMLLMLSLNHYWDVYFKEYRNIYSWSWQYGYKEVVNYAKENYEKYDKIIITKKYGEPHEYFLFYWSWSPKNFQNDPNLIRFYQSQWYWVDKFDKFYFVNDWDIPTEEWQNFVLESNKETIDCRSLNCLLITSPGRVPKTWNKLKTINFLDSKAAFEIYEN